MLKPNNALLVKGVACTVLGLAVVAAPYVVHSPSIRSITSSVSLVGWFVLALGAMLILRYIKSKRPKPPEKPLTSSILKPRPPP